VAETFWKVELALIFVETETWGLGSTANPVAPPELKPRAMRKQFIMPSICSRDIAGAQRSNVGYGKHLL